MKKFTLSSFLVVLLLALHVHAGFIAENIVAYGENIMNLLKEKNVKTDISYGGSSAAKLDVYYNKSDTKTLKPVVIFVHGGAWVIGSKTEYSRIGSLLVRENYVAVLPEYLLFPLGSIDDMVNDVYKAVQWTVNNISKYGGDPSKITLTGHSAGAHLIALTAFKSALRLKNNGVNLAPLPRLEKMVLFNGPYDFDDYDVAKFFSDIPIDHGVFERFISFLVNNDDISPNDVLKAASSGSISDFGMPKIITYYTGKDQLVPTSSAEVLIKQIGRVSPNTDLRVVYKDSYDHFTCILGVQFAEKDQEAFFMEMIRM